MKKFRPTPAQRKALSLIKSKTKHILLFGGSRSGKTTLLVMVIIFRAIRYPGSRHLICRLRLKDAKSSVLHETLLPWLEHTIGSKRYKLIRHENFIQLYNGSEIWIGGLGDREQVDRILGHEYNTIYFNEVSQISYHAVTTAYSRLAMKIPGCRNLFLYDCNPASPLHWAYKVFIRKIDFKTDTPIVKPEMYESMLINPEDNLLNLADDYIEDVLDILPERQKARFRHGLWVKSDGCIYDRFEESMIIDPNDLPEMEYYTAGQDFGLNMAAVKIGYNKDKVYIVKDHGGHNITTRTFNTQLTERNWFKDDMPVYCDPAGGERIQEITGGQKANNAVDPGIDYINSLIERNRLLISSECTGVLSEIWDYSRDEDDKIIKVNDHYMDALRYGVFTGAQSGIILS
ncbi:MAG: terminase [Spirochaetales bacterium]|nr:terminase [Spirochaetales bacterium]